MDDVRRTIITAIAATVLVGGGCGVALGLALGPHNAPSSTSATQTQTAAADPVEILLQMHVPVLPGATAGRVDIDGARYASGQFASGEQVTVDTYASQAAEDADIARNPSNDVNKLLVGRLFTVTVTGVDGGSGIVFPVPVSTLAKESGALVG